MSVGKSVSSVDIVAAAYGRAHVPIWALALAVACDKDGRAAVARRLDYSESVLSQTLSNTYGGNLDKVIDRVRAVILEETMECPAEGPMALEMCQRHQSRRREDIQNGWHHQMYQACRSGCSHFKGSK
jgi:hypothetical protein